MSIEFVQIGFLLMESRWFCENRYKERTFKWVDWNSPLRTLSDYAQVSRFFIEIDAVFSNNTQFCVPSQILNTLLLSVSGSCIHNRIISGQHSGTNHHDKKPVIKLSTCTLLIGEMGMLHSLV
jgi:hypothetical protein